MLANSHYVRYTKAAAVFIESSSMFALVTRRRRYEITHNILRQCRTGNLAHKNHHHFARFSDSEQCKVSDAAWIKAQWPGTVGSLDVSCS